MVARYRGFETVEEHDEHIITTLQNTIHKRDKLYILGDVSWKKPHLYMLLEVPGSKELIFGNHDYLPYQEYAKVFKKLHGFRDYKGWWLSHCPVISQEIRGKGNIHGHIHSTGSTPQPEDKRYINVNIDMNDMKPVNFETIND